MTTSEALRVLTRFRKWQREETHKCPPFDDVAIACELVVNMLAVRKGRYKTPHLEPGPKRIP